MRFKDLAFWLFRTRGAGLMVGFRSLAVCGMCVVSELRALLGGGV